MLLLCTLQWPLFVSGIFLHLLLRPCVSTYWNPQIGFVSSDAWDFWSSIQEKISGFLTRTSEIYHETEEQQRLYSSLLSESFQAVENYAQTKDERVLRTSIADIVQTLFTEAQPVITLQMLSGERLETTLAALTKIDAHEFLGLRSELAQEIYGNSHPSGTISVNPDNHCTHDTSVGEDTEGEEEK